MYYTAKVAKQIVDYYSIALDTLEQGGNDEVTVVFDAVGSKLYKVRDCSYTFLFCCAHFYECYF